MSVTPKTNVITCGHGKNAKSAPVATKNATPTVTSSCGTNRHELKSIHPSSATRTTDITERRLISRFALDVERAVWNTGPQHHIFAKPAAKEPLMRSAPCMISSAFSSDRSPHCISRKWRSPRSQTGYPSLSDQPGARFDCMDIA